VFGADSHPNHEAEVLARIIATVDAFAQDGPSGDQLDQRRARVQKGLRDSTDARPWLERLSFGHLLGDPLDSVEMLMAESEAMQPADVALAAALIMDDALFCVPAGIHVPVRLRGYLPWNEPAVEGRHFRPRLHGLSRPDLEATIGPDGFSLRDVEGTATIRVDDAVGLFRWADRRRKIVRADGRSLMVADAVHWRHGPDLIRLIDETFPERLHIDRHETLPAPQRRLILPAVTIAAIALLVGGAGVAAIWFLSGVKGLTVPWFVVAVVAARFLYGLFRD